MDTNSNSYTFIFSGVMVVVVAVVLSYAAISLKPMQSQNVKLEKMQNILSSVGIKATAQEAEEAYEKYITEDIVLNVKGEVVTGNVKAFDLDLKKELAKDVNEQNFPLFKCNKDGEELYIIPMRGVGLWGPIWGYVALKNDLNTVYGTNFDHKTETPGLGAEINKGFFMDQFQGKKLFNEKGEFMSVKVEKAGKIEKDYPHGVDGISGGTITSNGVSEMFGRTLKNYLEYFKSKNTKPEVIIETEEEVVSEELVSENI
jgi:Na+-transporting NADH:ubiquinone oxidoreductase subunit C